MKAQFVFWLNPSSKEPVDGFQPGETYDFTSEQIDKLAEKWDVMITTSGTNTRYLCVDQKGWKFRQR